MSALIPSWVEAIATLVGAAAGLFAVWRYFLVLDVDVTAYKAEALQGEEYVNGIPQGPSITFVYRITNYGSRELCIGSTKVQRRIALSSPIPWKTIVYFFVENPVRLPPYQSVEIPFTIRASELGVYWLRVREYGSLRSRKLMLPELLPGAAPRS